MDAIHLLTQDQLISHLNIKKGITALVGGGGKTSLLYALADELSKRGRVIVTTTTHIFPPDHLAIVSDMTEDSLLQALSDGSVVCVGVPDGKGKLIGASIPALQLLNYCDYVLVEADGAKRLPLKAPAVHEPVIPEGTEHVVAVAGLDGIGRPIAETVFRPQLYASLLEKEENQFVAPNDVAVVLQHPQGQRKGVCDGMRFSVLLNKADTPQLRKLGNEVAAHLDEKIVSRVVIASLGTL